jgi:hypothetical protein
VEGEGACGWSTSYTNFEGLQHTWLYIVKDKLACNVEPDYQSKLEMYVYNLTSEQNKACQPVVPDCVQQNGYSCSITVGAWMIKPDNSLTCQPGVWSYNMNIFLHNIMRDDAADILLNQWYGYCRQGIGSPAILPK